MDRKTSRKCSKDRSSYPYVWIIGRIKTDGLEDYAAVHRLQDALKITLLDKEDKDLNIKVSTNSNVDMKTPPKEQVEAMTADQYFAYAAELIKIHPPHVTDEPIMAILKRIGFERGKTFNTDSLSSNIKNGLEKARHLH